MHIEKNLKITVTQEDVEQAIIQMIANEDPTIVVDEIDFVAKRNGEDKIGVIVNGHFGDSSVVHIRAVESTQAELSFEEPEKEEVTELASNFFE